jgi:peptidoglycan/xylan/chitin deacetylase (PgdA/CDA1 family)
MLAEQGEAAVKEEIEKSHEIIKLLVGLSDDELQYLRPPYLDWNKEVAKIAANLYGDRVILAHNKVGDYDWGHDHVWDEADNEAISAQANRIRTYAQEVSNEGMIFGFHDSAEYNLPGNKSFPNWENRALPTLEALPAMIDDLRRKNIEIKPLSGMELITESLAS